MFVAVMASLAAPVPAQTVRFAPAGSIAVRGDMIRIDGARAYLAAGNTLTIVDISNPAQPKPLGAYDLPDRIWGFSVAGSRAYMACDLHGLEILDVSNPAKVTRAGYYKTKGQAHSVDIFGKTALVADHMLGVAYLDVSNEAKPVLLGSVFVEGYPRYVALFGSLLYAVDSPAGFYVVDPAAAEPLDPVGAIQTADAGFGRIISVGVTDDAKAPKIAIVSGGRVLQIYDVSKPAAPVLLSTLATPGRGPRMAMKNRMAYVADNAEGIQVVDVSTPSKPRIVSSYKTAKPAIDVALVDSLVYVMTGRSFNDMTRRSEGDELLILRQSP